MLRVLDEWLLTPQRAAVHLPTRTAVIADVHLGYAQARNRAGEAVPLASFEQELAGLRLLRSRLDLRGLVVAGDLSEAGVNAAVAARLRDGLETIGLELLALVPGNHDRLAAGEDHGLPLQRKGVKLGAWRIVHGDGPLPRGKAVLGHHHPCLCWSGMRAACFLVKECQLVLPAFSRDAAGVNVLCGPSWRDHRCCVIAGEAVLDLGSVAEIPKGLAGSRGQARPRARPRLPAPRRHYQ